MRHLLIDDPSGAESLRRSLESTDRVAVDCEAAGFHRYSDQLCLVQLSVDEGDFLLDPLSFDIGPILQPVLEDRDVEVVMHGSDYDLRLLDRDLGISPRRIFDTQVVAALIGEPALGLSALLETHLGVKLSKKYQRADWAVRPLPEKMLGYAASDTRHLSDLADLLFEKLEAMGRRAWAEEEFELLEAIRHEAQEDLDPVTRVKGAKDLTPRELARLRVCLAWRDDVGRQMDRALFRVVDDRALIAIALQPPRSAGDLANVRGFSSSLARDHGPVLLERLAEADSLPESDIEPFPRPARSGQGRPTPEVEARLDRIKGTRNKLAAELRLDRGTLLPNAGLLDIATNPPQDIEDLAGRPSIKRWQVEATGEAILRALNGT